MPRNAPWAQFNMKQRWTHDNVFSALLFSELAAYLHQNNILDPHQSGFRAGYLTSLLLSFCRTSQQPDTVNHRLLLCDLQQLGVSGSALFLSHILPHGLDTQGNLWMICVRSLLSPYWGPSGFCPGSYPLLFIHQVTGSFNRVVVCNHESESKQKVWSQIGKSKKKITDETFKCHKTLKSRSAEGAEA